jgi:hypothetical protein
MQYASYLLYRGALDNHLIVFSEPFHQVCSPPAASLFTLNHAPSVNNERILTTFALDWLYFVQLHQSYWSHLILLKWLC